MFNPFKCRHKRTYEVTTKMNDGSLVVNHYCRKCEATVMVYTYGIDRLKFPRAGFELLSRREYKIDCFVGQLSSKAVLHYQCVS